MLSISTRWEEFVGVLCASTITRTTRTIAIDIATPSETADDRHGAITQRLGSTVPPLLLHGEHGSIVEPLTFSSPGACVTGTRLEDADRIPTIEVAVGLVLLHEWERYCRENVSLLCRSELRSRGRYHSDRSLCLHLL